MLNAFNVIKEQYRKNEGLGNWSEIERDLTGGFTIKLLVRKILKQYAVTIHTTAKEQAPTMVRTNSSFWELQPYSIDDFIKSEYLNLAANPSSKEVRSLVAGIITANRATESGFHYLTCTMSTGSKFIMVTLFNPLSLTIEGEKPFVRGVFSFSDLGDYIKEISCLVPPNPANRAWK